MTTQLIYNVYILTMDEQDTIFQHGYVYIEDDKIKQIGNMTDMLPKAERLVDGRNGILMPGMINTHTHCGMIPFRSLGDDIVDRLRLLLFPLEQQMTPNLVYNSSKYAMAEMLLAGVTTMADMYYFEDEVAKAACEMQMRAFVGPTIIDMEVCDAKDANEALKKAEAFIERWQGQEMIYPMIAPHAPNTNQTKSLVAIQQLAKKYHVPVMMHVSEMTYEIDYFKEQYHMTPIQYLASLDFFDQPFILVHGIFMTLEDMAYLKSHRKYVKIAHCIGANTKSAKGVAPVHQMRQHGLTVGLGTDGPSSGNTLDLFTQMRMVANFHKTKEADRALFTAKEIVRMATIEGAKVLGIDHEVGSIEVGKKADVTLIETQSINMYPLHDPYSVVVYSAISSNVDSVWINGRMVVKNKELLAHDITSLREQLDQEMGAFRQEVQHHQIQY